MIKRVQEIAQWIFLGVSASAALALFSFHFTSAITPLPNPDPRPGSFGIEAVKRQPAPTQGATITTPGDGASYSTTPIRVAGICPSGLLVQIYNNGVMVGSTMCVNGSFSLEVGLFVGQNQLSASVFDDLQQEGPRSNTRTVTYNNTSFSAFGQGITLTSAFGRRSAAASDTLSWPLQLSGGTGPYAFSIDWGDGSAAELKSQPLAGLLNIAHIYKKAGIYTVNVRVTDVNGVAAFVQLVAVSNGQVEDAAPVEDTDVGESRVVVLWVPIIILLILLVPTYWLGRRSQLVSLRNKMLRERDRYADGAEKK